MDLAQAAEAGALTERSLSYLVRHAHRAFVRALTVHLAPHRISVAEWAVLRVLWQQEGLTQVELAARMRVGKATLTPVLDALERKECLLRARDAEDRRKLNLHLTDHARSLKMVLLPYGHAMNQRALAGIDPREAETSRRVLDHIISNLEGTGPETS